MSAENLPPEAVAWAQLNLQPYQLAFLGLPTWPGKPIVIESTPYNAREAEGMKEWMRELVVIYENAVEIDSSDPG